MHERLRGCMRFTAPWASCHSLCIYVPLCFQRNKHIAAHCNRVVRVLHALCVPAQCIAMWHEGRSDVLILLGMQFQHSSRLRQMPCLPPCAPAHLNYTDSLMLHCARLRPLWALIGLAFAAHRCVAAGVGCVTSARAGAVNVWHCGNCGVCSGALAHYGVRRCHLS